MKILQKPNAIFPLLMLCLVMASCAPAMPGAQLSGATMGTTWNVTLSSDPRDHAAVGAGVAGVLERVNQSMSTWLPDSELSIVNRAPLGEWVSVSRELVDVLEAAGRISEATSGAFDVTVGPLVSLWGFGAEAADQLPVAGEVAIAREQVDFRSVQWRASPPAARRLGEVSIDLSAIAKGFAVDAVALWLEANGHADYLVEVGGEVRVAGRSPRGTPWRLGIERPDSLARDVASRIELTAGAVATSGDYRNFRVDQGVRRSHTIDPRTGYPVDHQVASVTVIAATAMSADGWATALTVLGYEDGLELAEQQSLPVLFIIRQADGFTMRASQGMQPYLDAARVD